MKNAEVAQIFNDIADILEIKGENPFRIRAYRKAAMNIESLTEDVEELIKSETLESVPGIGAAIAGKIKEIVATGKLKFHEDLKKEIPKGLLEMMAIPSVGPRTAKLLFEKLHIKTIDELEKKAKAHKIAGLPGLKEKTEENILHGIQLVKKGRERMPLGKAWPVAQEVVARLEKLPEVKRISPAGSLRRMKETIRDIDILVTSTKPEKVMKAFTSLPMVREILASGTTKSSIRTNEGIQVDCRVVDPNTFGAALCYFTGSKAHNIHVRKLANKLGLKISEYGVFKEKTNKRIAGKEEEDVYKCINLPWISPELREDLGEIEAAAASKLPKLVELKDIKGDFHIHTKWSDGAHSIQELVQAARDRGYKYISISDHSKTLKVAGGLSDKELLRQADEIRKLNKKLKGFTVLTGTEVEILKDGKLDYKDDVLKELDIVIAAIHSGFKQAREAMTKRILKGLENKYVHFFAHPTGRLMGVRDAYEVDLEKIFKFAKQANIHLEINAYPQRLDLTDINCRRAKELGVSLAIATDTHTISQLDSIALGVAVARRGWLGKKDLLNTAASASEVLKQVKRK